MEVQVIIISKRIRDAAEELLSYFEGHESVEDSFRKRLRDVAALPVMKPTNNPTLVMRFRYEGYRQGEFSEKEYCTLADYILIMCSGEGKYWSYSDVLGKHSEVEAPADQWDVDWEEHQLVSPLSADKWTWREIDCNNTPISDACREALWTECTTKWLDKEYTNLSDEDIPDWMDFKERFDNFVNDPQWPYAVKLTLKNAYEEGDHMNRPQKRDYSFIFDDARIAAAFYKRPRPFTIEIKTHAGWKRTLEITQDMGNFIIETHLDWENVYNVCSWVPEVMPDFAPGTPFEEML
jgi:hypothetical protein